MHCLSHHAHWPMSHPGTLLGFHLFYFASFTASMHVSAQWFVAVHNSSSNHQFSNMQYNYVVVDMIYVVVVCPKIKHHEYFMLNIQVISTRWRVLCLHKVGISVFLRHPCRSYPSWFVFWSFCISLLVIQTAYLLELFSRIICCIMLNSQYLNSCYD
jgi:hypothetical protein